jgi:hypothetical protein
VEVGPHTRSAMGMKVLNLLEFLDPNNEGSTYDLAFYSGLASRNH